MKLLGVIRGNNFLEYLDNGLDGIILPKIQYLKEILSEDLNIAYNIASFKIDYVLSLGDNEENIPTAVANSGYSLTIHSLVSNIALLVAI